MELAGLKMACFNTTATGVLRGVLQHYGLGVSDAFCFGASGHAFVINIHEALCPSGPYCWNHGPFHRLVANLGVEVVDHGFFHAGSSPRQRRQVEQSLVAELDRGVPCSLLNMENQLITGYDDTGLLTAQPWPGHDFPPRHLTFGTWEELGGQVHINFYSWHRREPAPEADAVAASLDYAVDLACNPAAHTCAPYATGLAAYPQWVAAVRAGHGAEHGNWWNGTVWSECRAMAALYLEEVGQRHPGALPLAGQLAEGYRSVADHLRQASDKALEVGSKVEHLEAAAARERALVARLPELAAAVRAARVAPP